MIKAICIKKIRDKNGNITNYILKDANNKTVKVGSDELKTAIKNNKIRIINLKLTSDNKLVNRKSNYNNQKHSQNTVNKKHNTVNNKHNTVNNKHNTANNSQYAINKNQTTINKNQNTVSQNQNTVNIIIKPDIITLYHGSPNEELIPKHGKGKNHHDYGKGLYLTEDIELAREWAASSSGGKRKKLCYVHKFSIDKAGLKILDFDELDPLCWVAELMHNRVVRDDPMYAELAPIFCSKYKPVTDDYDIIKGWRADSSYFSIVKYLIRDQLSLSRLDEALRLGNLGIQWCIKSERAFDMLKSDTNYKAIECLNVNKYIEKYTARDLKARDDQKLMRVTPYKLTDKDRFSTIIKSIIKENNNDK
jgi:hypothetical protein